MATVAVGLDVNFVLESNWAPGLAVAAPMRFVRPVSAECAAPDSYRSGVELSDGQTEAETVPMTEARQVWQDALRE
jgi:hypothetical protein